MSKVRTFRKAKWLCFAAAIVSYFAPLIVVTGCMFPFIRNADVGYKVALGVFIVAINGIPFLLGVFKSFFVHFPMFNIFAVCFCVLGALFSFDIFAEYIDKFLYIELAAALGSIAACIFWAFFKKYSAYAASIKATIKSGAFIRS